MRTDLAQMNGFSFGSTWRPRWWIFVEISLVLFATYLAAQPGFCGLSTASDDALLRTSPLGRGESAVTQERTRSYSSPCPTIAISPSATKQSCPSAIVQSCPACPACPSQSPLPVSSSSAPCPSATASAKGNDRATSDLSLRQRYNALIGPNAKQLKPGVTAILTVFKRGANFARQLAALDASSMKPSQYFVWQTGSHSDINASTSGRADIGHIHIHGYDFMYHGRFLPTLMVETEWVCLFDDDTIPQSRYIENAIETIKQRGINTVAGATGRVAVFAPTVAPSANGEPSSINRNVGGKTLYKHEGFATNRRGTTPTDADEVHEPFQVDFVIHSYCFHSSLARSFWALPHYTWLNGEDLSFGAALQLAANASFIVPRQIFAEGTHGDSDVKLGGDEVAAHKRSGHHQLRSELLHHWVDMGWRPLHLPVDGYLDPSDHCMRRGVWPTHYLTTVRSNNAHNSSGLLGGSNSHLQGLQSPGHWSQLPVSIHSRWIPDILDSVNGSSNHAASENSDLMVMLGNRQDAIRLLAGRDISFLGDSLSRWQYYSALAWLFGCLDFASADYDAAPLPYVTQALRHSVCADVETTIGPESAKKHSHAPHRTIIPTAADDDNGSSSSGPLVLSWGWNAYVQDLITSGNKTVLAAYGQPPPGPSASELLGSNRSWVVLSAGLWHLRYPRGALDCRHHSPGDDYDGLLNESAQLISQLQAATAVAGIDARAHVLWRGLPLLERQFGVDRSRGCWRNEHVRRAAAATNALWRDAGFPVVDMTRFHAGMPPDPDNGLYLTTVDGFHPNMYVMVHAFRETAASLLLLLRAHATPGMSSES